MKKILLALPILLIILSCSDDNGVTPNAELVTFDEIITKTGYLWFSDEYQAYEPEMSKVEEIANNFDPSTEKFIVFAKPSCTCNGDHYYFSKFMRVIDEAGIDHSNLEIYAMSSKDNKHPYQDILEIKKIPAFFIVKNDTPRFSVFDSLYNSQKYKDDPIIENVVLDGLVEVDNN